MRQVRRAAEAITSRRRAWSGGSAAPAAGAVAGKPPAVSGSTGRAMTTAHKAAGRELRLDAWRWAQANRAEDGSLPSGRDIGSRYGRHERWGRMVKRSGLSGEIGT
jgi:hypothetical protein